MKYSNSKKYDTSNTVESNTRRHTPHAHTQKRQRNDSAASWPRQSYLPVTQVCSFSFFWPLRLLHWEQTSSSCWELFTSSNEEDTSSDKENTFQTKRLHKYHWRNPELTYCRIPALSPIWYKAEKTVDGSQKKSPQKCHASKSLTHHPQLLSHSASGRFALVFSFPRQTNVIQPHNPPTSLF